MPNNIPQLKKMASVNSSMEEQILMIYPTAEECKLNNMVKCTQESCQSIFSSESNLNLHLSKTHKISNAMQQPRAKQYYCPELDCVYHTRTHFKSMKCLRQHYLKKHSSKHFVCTSCSKGFPCQNHLSSHQEYCGIDFTCSDCDASYPCYETLKTHGRRKKHKVLSKTEFKHNLLVSKTDSKLFTNKNCLILPKSNVNLIIIPNMDRTVLHQESQTIDEKPDLRSKMTQISRSLASLTSQQTQTGNKNVKLTVETQTIGDFIHINQKNPSHLFGLLDQKSSITQTDVIESKNSSCNTSFNMEDFEFAKETEMSNSGTQTQNNIFSTSTMTHDSIYTDTSDLLTDTLDENICSFEFDNCHMETQTDFMFEEDMFNCDYMSNTYTQTCEDILGVFGFNDIQTQTVFEDMLRSVESQTMMSQRKQNNGEIKYVANMETQTDTEFREMLEVINS
ncbi:unnamed protein product [Phaedon cochleariae]|uniref:C2H2-type domain-containing protein n=1 Tax=Phaedon cochleariae TaxID=80249 RepID=A0A9P0DID2_PHACE|nr:unnamed protein product [Phaedon cochleariae]